MATRRRGEELHRAILEATWALFIDRGYDAVTMQNVAESAETSKPVLYRRWDDRDALLRDAVDYGLGSVEIAAPDTGSLRGDLLAVMDSINETLVGLAAVMSVHLASYFAATGTSPSELREAFISERTPVIQAVMDRGVARGEIDPNKLTPRIASMPFDLMRAEIVSTMKPTPRQTLEEIVDTIFLPLVTPADHVLIT